MNDVILTQDLVFVDQKEAYTDSLTVARVFNKEHGKVLRDIRLLVSELESFGGEAKFGLSSYISDQNKELPKYLMDKDALLMLVMGYKGVKATEIRYKYIQAFNKMHEYISNQIDLQDQLFRAMEKEEISFANGSMAGKYLQKRKTEKPINKAEIESILQRLQIDMFEEIKENKMIH